MKRVVIVSFLVCLAVAGVAGCGRGALYSMQHYVSSEPWVFTSYLAAMSLSQLLYHVPGLVLGVLWREEGLIGLCLAAIPAHYAFAQSAWVVGELLGPVSASGPEGEQIVERTLSMDIPTATVQGVSFLVANVIALFAAAYVANRVRTSNPSLQARRP